MQQQPEHRQALELAAMAAMHAGDLELALASFWRLLRAFPDEAVYCDRLAQLAERGGRPQEGSRAYEYFLERHPEALVSRFNHARLLRSRGENEEALTQYRRCLADGIDSPEEVETNIGALLSDLHRPQEARAAFERALQLRADHVPALYNLGLLLEEQGDWPAARERFERVLELDSRNAEAAARLLQGQAIDSSDHPALQTVQGLLALRDLHPAGRESLYYALGKALDDCAEYAAAFRAYSEANALSRQRVPAYSAEAQQQLLQGLLDAPVLDLLQPVSDRPLVFVCGMFRSGSTLLEQMLAGHSALQSGGEIGFISGRVELPQWADAGRAPDWQALGRDYLAYLDRHFAADAMVLDKRPDNFLYLPMLLRLFPRARVLHTRRQPLDNCLSVFFQQLGSDFRYANSLPDTAHYLLGERHFIEQLAQGAPGRIHDVSYEALVADARAVLGDVLAFLGLPWEDACLSFTDRETRVRTASVSQVRQQLYQSSAGRWRNYEGDLQELAGLFPESA